MKCYCFNRYDLSSSTLIKPEIYIALAKNCSAINLGEFKEIKNTLLDKSENPESLKKLSQQFESFSINLPIVSEDLLRAFYRLFYLQF